MRGRLISIVGGLWGTGGGRPRGPHLLDTPQNFQIPKCPKMPQNGSQIRGLELPRLRWARPPDHKTDKPNEEEAGEEAKEEDG